MDSLDECRLSIPKAAQALLRGFASLPIDRPDWDLTNVQTELCKSLTDFLFGSQDHLICIDVSEFMEKHLLPV